MPTPITALLSSEERIELFKWHNMYSVNNEEIDNHHKTLFSILNRLYENCMGVDQPNNLKTIVEELISYSKYHFSAEEKHMRNIGYKGTDKQIIEHRLFTQKTLQLQKVVNNNDLEHTKELIVFLGKWILNHVMEEDKKISVQH
jgi:hemerythrin